MVDVSTHLFYGVFATTSSLLIASKAFSRVQLPFLAIDFILFRKSNSTLQVNQKRSLRSKGSTGDIGLLPEEVLVMIKKELIGIELVESERKFVKSLLCAHCARECDCFSSFPGSFKHYPTTWAELLTLPGCDSCFEAQMEIYNYSTFPDQEDKLKVTKFLSSFGLQIIAEGKVGDDFLDLESFSPVGIATKSTSQSCKHFEEAVSFHAITTLGSDAFNLPSSHESIARRFNALKKYRVEFGDHKTKTKKSQRVEKTEEKTVEQKKEAREDKSYENPSWQLWTEGFCGY